ncbi:MAG: hypothetical protein PVI67_11470, partial [Anaerolineae bacterium]
MSVSSFSEMPDNSIEQVLVWFYRLTLLFLPLEAVIRGEYQLALWLVLIAAIHALLYLAAPRLLSQESRVWALSLTDVALAGFAFFA